MITIDDLRASTYKQWSAQAWVDGQPYAITGGLPTRTMSALRPRSTAQCELLNLPPTSSDLPVIIDLILNGTKRERFFTGKTDQRSAQSRRWQRAVNVVDLFNRDRAIATVITWDNRAFADAVTDILTAAGVAATDIDTIYSPGSGYALGSVYPITITANCGQILNQLLTYGGAALYVTPAGRVRVVDNPGLPTDSSTIIYARGCDLAAGEFGLTDAGYSIEGNEGVVSSFTATGPKRPDGAIPDGTFTATGITGRTESVTYPYLQTDALAQTIAERELNRRARARVNVWFEAPLNPRLLPGDALLFRDEAIGYSRNTPAMVTEVATTADGGMRVQLSMGVSLVSGYRSSIAPPVVDFAMTIEQQLLTLAGVPALRAFVQCADQSRDQAGYALTAWAWTATGAAVTPTTSSETSPMFHFATLDGAAISLTVTSETGEVATLTKQPVATQTQIFSRVVSVATAAGWRVLNGATWQTFSDAGACTAVPAFNETGGYLYAGFTNGTLYRSADILATAPSLMHTFAAAVQALFVNEGDPTHLSAAIGAALWVSQDAGTTWALRYTFTDLITDLQSSPGNVNELRVCVGNREYISYDGATFSPIVTGVAGSTAVMIATAAWGHAVAFNGTTLAADCLMFEEGYAVDWTTVAEASRPHDGLTAITPLLDEPGYIAAAGSINDLVRDGTLTALVLLAHGGTSGNLYKLLWNGSTHFVATLLTTATVVGAGKLINQASAYAIDDVAATQIGYGPLATPTPVAEVLLPTAGMSPGGVWHYTTSWILKNNGLPSGWYWRKIATNPLNPRDWLLVGDNGTATASGGVYLSAGQPVVYRTLDAGATWTGIALPQMPERGASLDLSVGGIGYTTTNKLFVFAHVYELGIGEDAVLWSGTTTLSVVAYDLDGGTNQARVPLAAFAAPNSDIFTVRARGSYAGGFAAGYAVPGSTALVDTFMGGGIGDGIAITPWDVRAAAFVVQKADGLQLLRNYRGTDFAAPTTAVWASYALPIVIDQTVIAQVGWYELQRITDLATGAVATACLTTPRGIAALASDPQTMTIGAVLYGYDATTAIGIHVTHDAGVTWVALPAPPPSTTYSLVLAVIGRVPV